MCSRDRRYICIFGHTEMPMQKSVSTKSSYGSPTLNLAFQAICSFDRPTPVLRQTGVS